MTSMPSVAAAARQDHRIGSLFGAHLAERRTHAGGHVTFNLHVNLHESSKASAPDRRDHANSAVFGNLVVGEHRQRRARVAHQARNPGADLRRDQQHRGLAGGLLPPRAVGERLSGSGRRDRARIPGRASPPPPSSPAALARAPGSKVMTGSSWRRPPMFCTMLRPSATRTAATSATGSCVFGASSASVSQMVRKLRIGTRSSSRYCSTLTTTLIGKSFGTRSSTSFGAALAQAVQHLLHFFVAQQLVRVRLQQMAQVSRDDAARIDDGVALGLRLIAPRLLDPHGVQTEGRILGGGSRQRARHLSRIDGQLAIREHLGLAHGRAQDGDAIGIRRELQVVADVHRLHQEAQLLGQLLAHALDAAHQFAALCAIDQRDQPVADLEPDEIDGLDVVPGQLALLRRAPRGRGGAARAAAASAARALAQDSRRRRRRRRPWPGTPNSACRE